MPDNEVDLAREVLIAAPYDNEVTSTVLLESVPVWFDLGWQKVADQDYGIYNDLNPAAADSSFAVDKPSEQAPVVAPKAQKTVAPNPPPGS